VDLEKGKKFFMLYACMLGYLNISSSECSMI